MVTLAHLTEAAARGDLRAIKVRLNVVVLDLLPITVKHGHGIMLTLP